MKTFKNQEAVFVLYECWWLHLLVWGFWSRFHSWLNYAVAGVQRLQLAIVGEWPWAAQSLQYAGFARCRLPPVVVLINFLRVSQLPPLF